MKTAFDIADLPKGCARLCAGLLLICPWPLAVRCSITKRRMLRGSQNFKNNC